MTFTPEIQYQVRHVVLSLICLAVASAQAVEISPAPPLDLPGRVDSNSPAYWRDGQMYLFNSYHLPIRSTGTDISHLSSAQAVAISGTGDRWRWIESVWSEDDGTLYAWYHTEPPGVCPGVFLTAPKIGALVSYDRGETFEDLGIVLESGDLPDCKAQNGYFAGGHGDFSVVLGQDRRYFYFLFGNYGGSSDRQGIGIARMAFGDRRLPAGKVWKFANGGWSEPGLGGRVEPVFRVVTEWNLPDADAFWGPSIHWNTALNSYIVLLNHACCSPGWPQEGIYISLNTDISNPYGWTTPRKILDSNAFYPEVIGNGENETDAQAGAVARLFVGGHSEWEIQVSNVQPGVPGHRQLSSQKPIAFRTRRPLHSTR